MKKFLLLSLLVSAVVPAVMASDDVVQEAAIKKMMPAHVTITKAKAEGRYVLQFEDPVIKNSYKSLQVGMENSKDNCVQISYTLNRVKQENNWYGADFSRTVILLEEGTQNLIWVTAEQKNLIENADLDLKDKKALISLVREEGEQATNKIRSFIGVREQAAEAEAAQKEAEEKPAAEEIQAKEAATTDSEEGDTEDATKAPEVTEATEEEAISEEQTEEAATTDSEETAAVIEQDNTLENLQNEAAALNETEEDKAEEAATTDSEENSTEEATQAPEVTESTEEEAVSEDQAEKKL